MDFFTVPTVRFGVLYCFFVIAHERRRILHCNVTKVVRQVREAFPFGLAPRFLIFDRDRKYGLEVPAAVRSLGIEAMQTSSESPWQNGVAERRIGSCRREQNRPWIPNRNTSRGACAQAYRRLRYPRYRSPFAYPTPRAGKKGLQPSGIYLFGGSNRPRTPAPLSLRWRMPPRYGIDYINSSRTGVAEPLQRKLLRISTALRNS